MLNIISNEIFKPKWMVTGQTKVFRNLIRGLDKIKYPYVLNKKHDYCDKLWIYNDWRAIEYLENLDTKKTKVLFGPDYSFWKMLKGSKSQHKLVRDCVALFPSVWSRDMLVEHGFNYCSMDVWPAGIDTEKFKPSNDKKDRVLIYFKQRFDFELSLVIEVLKKRSIKYSIIIYGNYKEIDYQNELKYTKYIVWVGRQESQGIALEEALAVDIPILVWDVSCLGHWDPSTKNEEESIPFEWLSFSGAKVAPYFNDTCGKIINYSKDISAGIDFMEDNLNEFKPRSYILSNLTLEKQARALTGLFPKHWVDSEKDFRSNNDENWKNLFIWKLLTIIYYKFKKFRKILHLT